MPEESLTSLEKSLEESLEESLPESLKIPLWESSRNAWTNTQGTLKGILREISVGMLTAMTGDISGKIHEGV